MKKLFSLVLALAAITTMTFAATAVQQDCGKRVRISATPDEGYKFVMWEEDGDTNPEREVTVSEDATFTAVFAKIKVTIPAGNLPDSVDIEGTHEDGDYEYWDELTIKAKDDYDCKKFVGWSDQSTTDKERTFIVGKDDLANFQPKYEDIYYTIRFFEEDGTTQIGTDLEVLCGATPTEPTTEPTKQGGEEGHTYEFTGWNVVPAAKDSNYVAKFADTMTKYPFDGDSFDENVDVEDENGNEPNGEYDYGKQFTITAKDNYECKKFKNWRDGYQGLSREFTVGTDDPTNDKFVPVYEDFYYTIIFYDDDKATVIDTKSVKCGDMPTAPTDPTKAEDAEHTYTFKDWGATIVVASKDTEYVAVYEAHDRVYTIPGSDLPDENVDVEGDHENGEYNYGDQIKFTPQDIECDEFIGWVDDTDNTPHKENPRIFTVGVDDPSILQYFVPQYQAIKYTITTAVKLGDDSQTHGTVSAEVVNE